MPVGKVIHAVTAFAVLSMAACGGNDGTPMPGPTPSPTPAVTANAYILPNAV